MTYSVVYSSGLHINHGSSDPLKTLQDNFEGLEDDKRIEGKGSKTFMFDKIMFIFSDFSQIFAFPCKKYWILFIVFGHLMPLFNTNSREITGNRGEREREGTYMQKSSPAVYKQGMMRFIYGPLGHQSTPDTKYF